MGRPPKTPNDELDKFLLRMPDGLRERIKTAAEKNNRSMNAEIVATLEAEYPAPEEFNAIQLFWDRFGLRIMDAADPDLKRQLIDEANEFLEKDKTGLRVIEVARKDGKPTLTFTAVDD